MRAWVNYNKLENITSILIYDLNHFKPSGTLCYYKEKVESELAVMMPITPLKKVITFPGTFNISYLNPNTIMMTKILTTPLMRRTGYCKQEENI